MARVRTVLDLPTRFADGGLSRSRLLRELTQIPGVGFWTVHG